MRIFGGTGYKAGTIRFWLLALKESQPRCNVYTLVLIIIFFYDQPGFGFTGENIHTKMKNTFEQIQRHWQNIQIQNSESSNRICLQVHLIIVWNGWLIPRKLKSGRIIAFLTYPRGINVIPISVRWKRQPALYLWMMKQPLFYTYPAQVPISLI